MRELETGRLLLRAWRPEDLGPLAALNADSRVMACFPACLDRMQSDALAERFQMALTERGWGVWAVELKETGRFVGFVGLNEVSTGLPFSPCVEILWRLAYGCWGRGYALEAARAVLDIAFGSLGLAEVVAFTASLNQRSRVLMRRLGMTEVGFFDHPALPDGHYLREHVLFRIKR